MKYTIQIKILPIVPITLKLFFFPHPGSNQVSHMKFRCHGHMVAYLYLEVP